MFAELESTSTIMSFNSALVHVVPNKLAGPPKTVSNSLVRQLVPSGSKDVESNSVAPLYTLTPRSSSSLE